MWWWVGKGVLCSCPSKVLSDDSKRQTYDAIGHSEYTSHNTGGGGGGGGGKPFTSSQAEEIFRQFFGGNFGGFNSAFDGARDFTEHFTSGEVNQLVLNLTFDDSVQGCSKEVSIRVQGTCDRCHGTGGEPGTKEQTCPTCRGRGEVSSTRGVWTPLMVCDIYCRRLSTLGFFT